MKCLMNNPLISVIIPTYNSENFILETLDGIFQQTYDNFEIIVVDDKSNDSTYELIKNINDSRIRIYQNEKNIGYVNTLNKLIKLSKGQFIARNDHDDISLKKRFELQLKMLLKYPDMIVCGGQIKIFGSRSKRIFYPTEPSDIRAFMLFNNPIHHPTAMFRASEIKKIGYNVYDPKFTPSEDYHLWSRLSYFSTLRNINECILKYRIHSNNYSKVVKSKQKDTTMRIRKKYIKDYLEIDLREEENLFLNKLIHNDNFQTDELNIFKNLCHKLNGISKTHPDKNSIRGILTYFWIKAFYLSVIKQKNNNNLASFFNLRFLSFDLLSKKYLIKKIFSHL